MMSVHFAERPELIPVVSPLFSGDELAVFSRMIDWQMTGLEDARDLWQQGLLEEALILVSKVVLNELSRNSDPFKIREVASPLELAEEALRDRICLHNDDLIFIGRPINWFTRIDVDRQWTIHISYMNWINALAVAYQKTGDERFAGRWFEVIEDFLDHIPYGCNALDYSPSQPLFSIGRKTCNNGESSSGPDTWISLSCHCRTDNWLAGLTALAKSPAATPRRVLRILTSLYDEHLFVMLTNPRENTPNQFLSISASVLALGLAVPYFKGAASAFLIGFDRLLRAVDNVMLPDGSDLEQSINYNISFCDRLLNNAERLDRASPERAQLLRKFAERRALFVTATLTPAGRTVSLAKTGIQPMVDRIVVWGSKLNQPAITAMVTGSAGGEASGITSLAFPYGGYYVMRSDWSREADYLFLKTSRHGIGHMHEDCLSLHVSSGGTDLIVDAGNFSYTTQTPLDAAMNEYCHSTRSHSSVLVDGFGQARMDLKKTRAWNHDEAPHLRAAEQKPLPDRVWQGRWMEFAEGFYTDGYGPEALVGVEHHRMVVWIKGLGWLVLDRMSSAVGHTFSQIWTLSPELKSAEALSFGDVPGVLASGAGQSFSLLTWGDERHRVAVHLGEDGPVRGWFSPRYGDRVPKADVWFDWVATSGISVRATLLVPSSLAGRECRSSTQATAEDFQVQADLGGLGKLTVDLTSLSSHQPGVQVEWLPTDGFPSGLRLEPGSAMPGENWGGNTGGREKLMPMPTTERFFSQSHG